MQHKKPDPLEDAVVNVSGDPPKDKGGYDLAEEVTGLKRSTIASMVSRKQIPFIRLGRRLPIFSRRDLTKWMEARKVAPANATKVGG